MVYPCPSPKVLKRKGGERGEKGELEKGGKRGAPPPPLHQLSSFKKRESKEEKEEGKTIISISSHALRLIKGGKREGQKRINIGKLILTAS